MRDMRGLRSVVWPMWMYVTNYCMSGRKDEVPEHVQASGRQVTYLL